MTHSAKNAHSTAAVGANNIETVIAGLGQKVEKEFANPLIISQMRPLSKKSTAGIM